MNMRFIYGMLAVILLSVLAYAVSTSNMGNILAAGDINVSGTIYGTQNWTHTNYPSACSAGYAVTTIGDSNTCTEFLLTTGGTLAGNLAMGNYNITGVNELSSTLVDTTNLEVDNLESNMDGTGYNITMANTIVPTNGKVCLNNATCTAYVYYNGTDTVIVSP